MKVMVVCGSSGGHIFPALAFLEKLREKTGQLSVVLVLPKKHIGIKLEESGYILEYLPVSEIRLSLEKENILALLNFIKSFFISIGMFFRFKPDLVVGFGTLVSVPPVLLAWFFRTETLIHEQNVVPGRATRMLAHVAGQIALSFPESAKYFKSYSSKIIITGNPLRKDIYRLDRKVAMDYFGLLDKKFTILVIGGSQGSRRINRAFVEALAKIPERFSLQVIHLCGPYGHHEFAQEYENLDVVARLFIFLEEMRYAYSAADLVISRSGATTIAELLYFQIPAVLIPYPYAHQHQFYNAEVLVKGGSALVLKDNELEQGKLYEALESMINKPLLLEEMRLAYKSFPSLDAANLLSEAALSLNKI